MRPSIIAMTYTLFVCGFLSAQTSSRSLLVATDALGRKMENNHNINREKKVGLFYWSWHCDHLVKTDKARNISSILKAYPDAENSLHPAWDIGNRKRNIFFWEEPLLGYYKTTDPWVLRKHAEWLADAGVDFVVFDCSNGSFTWKESYDVLLSVWSKALRDGVEAPKIAFLLPFAPNANSKKILYSLYDDIYRDKKYGELWFSLDGKPLVLAYKDNLDETIDKDRKIKELFTFRAPQPDYVDGKSREDHWSWLEVYPQNMYGAAGTKEQMSVSVAQNTNAASGGHCYAFNAPNSYGRSYTAKAKNDRTGGDSHLWGYNFQEQWDRVFELDPQIAFVTGWNEFVVDQHVIDSVKKGWPPWNPMKPFAFPDQYNWECSRDIEPVKNWGKYGDNYYLQLADNIRRFKGVDIATKASSPKSIAPGKWSDWDNVEPSFDHYKGNTFHRDHKGYANLHYFNTSGRNDLVKAKVSRDNKFVYFYIETAENITKPVGENWMTLFIDIDRNKESGWSGYDLVVNRLSPESNKVVIEKNTGNNWNWRRASLSELYIKDNMLYFPVAIELFDCEESSELEFEFKWNDNMQTKGDILDFYVNGDSAPTGRFNFLYKTK